MSDREIIITNLTRAKSRIRTNRLFGGIASALSAFIALAILVTLLNLLVSLPTTVIVAFWVLWFAGLAAYVIKILGRRTTLLDTAAHVDRQASLNDEVVSAYWFVSHDVSNPWVDLQVRRAAATASKLDFRSLYPRTFPRASYLAAMGLVLLIALNLAPIEPGQSNLFSNPQPDVAPPSEPEELFNEIAELLERAEALEPSQSISDFQALVDSMQNSRVDLADAEQQMEDIAGLIDEGNLTIASILEGLENVGEDLTQSDDTIAAGQDLMDGDLASAALELEELAGELSRGRDPEANLADVLEEAASNRQPGLEELANQLEAAAEALQDQNPEAVDQALIGSAESLSQLADIIESQRLQNEAAASMDALQDALRQEQAAAPDSDFQEDPITSAEDDEQGQQMDAPFLLGEGNPQPAQDGSPGNQEIDGQGLAGMQLEATSGAGQGPEPGDQEPGGDINDTNPVTSGLFPMGYGYSPAIKEGAPTSLEIQLQEELIEVQMDQVVPDGPEETQLLTTRRGESTLDYRNVESNLTPAQQELLNQDRIPPEYRNVIKDYFEAIRTKP